jgi:hypothetical protein
LRRLDVPRPMAEATDREAARPGPEPQRIEGMKATMSRLLRVLLCAAIAALVHEAVHAADAHATYSDPATMGAVQRAALVGASRPPLLAGVVDLSFAEFFRRPVGPYGLEPSAKLLALDGKRVRIEGYVVEEEAPTPGLFILSPFPVSLSDVEDGPADDLPGCVVFVHLQGADAQASVQHQSAPLLLVGTLQVGNRVEANDRVSAVRMLLDAPAPRNVGEPPRKNAGAAGE